MIILVIGMHRSGTSMVARGLHAMGANLGESVNVAPRRHNPHGHWEHNDVWRTQERLLAQLGRQWQFDPRPLPEGWAERPGAVRAIERFARIASAEVERHGHWLVKDPRSSLLIPLWRSVAARASCELRIIRIRRDAEEVAASLAARDAMPHDLAIRIWRHHHDSIDRDATGLEALELEHCAIMADPVCAFARMGAFCALPDSAGGAAAAAALVDRSLWHHQKSRAPAEMTQSLGAAGVAAVKSRITCCASLIGRSCWRLRAGAVRVRGILSRVSRGDGF